MERTVISDLHSQLHLVTPTNAFPPNWSIILAFAGEQARGLWKMRSVLVTSLVVLVLAIYLLSRSIIHMEDEENRG